MTAQSLRRMFVPLISLALLFTACANSHNTAHSASQAPSTYFPPPGQWQHHRPSDEGMDDAKLAEAIAWAQTQETDWPKDFSKQTEIFGKPLGPVPTTRASTNGLIIRRGYIIAEFGDTTAVDPTYSVAKSYLSTILGLTLDRGTIPHITDPVANLIHDGGYDPHTSPHNAKITWQHHATQTSEWEGELFGKSHTFIGAEDFGKEARKPRDLHDPGTFYEYNDVRINRLSLSLLELWQRPLPDVLKTEIMDPIGASNTWHWYGYSTSTVTINGQPMQSVSGGTRWGGGLWMSSLDHARFGYLILRKGRWQNKQLISEHWLQEATRPQGVNPEYGYLWWLNTKNRWPNAPANTFAALGAGNNSIWIDPDHDLVVVWRWHRANSQNEFYKRILDSINPDSK
jgi:CubicO group peptidase (beta-lactamase class C family)